MELAGRSAVIAGGAGGLGSATARRLVSGGAAVVLLDPDTERADALARELGDAVRWVEGGATDDDAVGSAIDLASTLGTFSIAVSATGVIIPAGRIVDAEGAPLDKDALLANLELHVVGPFNLARLAAAAFTRNEPDAEGERGVIVLTASISAYDGMTTMVPYAAAKGAVVSMTLPMARDLGGLGVRVCTIAPGSFATPRLSTPSIQRALTQDVVFPKRLGKPDEFAQLVEAMVRNPYLNGEVVRLDGATRLPPSFQPH